MDAEKAKAAVNAWFERKKHPVKPAAVFQSEQNPEPEPAPVTDRVKVETTDTRLNELKH